MGLVRVQRPWRSKPPFGHGRLTPEAQKNTVLRLLLNEGAGTIAHDISGRGNHGTINGATWEVDAQSGLVLRLNGSSDYISPGAGSSLNITGDITIIAEVNVDAFVGDISQSVYQKYKSTTPWNGYGFLIYNAGVAGDKRKFAYWSGLAQGWKYSNSKLTAGESYTLGVSCIGTTGTLYLNGLPDGTFTCVAPADNASEIAYIGTNDNINSYLDGPSGSITVLNRGLTAQEMRANYDTPYQDIKSRSIWLPTGVTAPPTEQPITAFLPTIQHCIRTPIQ